MSKIGLKIVREDDGSLTSFYGRVFYPMGEWVDVPGIGAFVAISGGLFNAGDGPKCIYLECEGRGRKAGKEGVYCFSRVRQIPPCPEKLDERLRFLPELVDDTLNQDQIAQLLITHPEISVQRLAVKRIKDEATLFIVAMNHPKEISSNALTDIIERITNQDYLFQIAQNNEIGRERVQAVEKIEDPFALLEIVKKANEDRTVFAALKRLKYQGIIENLEFVFE